MSELVRWRYKQLEVKVHTMRRIVVAVGLSVALTACSGGESNLTLDDVTTTTETPTSTTQIVETTSTTTTTEPPPTTTTTTTAPEERIELTADGQQNTDPFDLSGGRYTVAYSFTGDCYYGARLAPTDGDSFGDSIASGSGPVDGSTNVYGVDAGTYYVSMITGPPPGCPWRIVLVRQ